MRIFLAEAETVTDRFGDPMRRAAFDRTGVTSFQAWPIPGLDRFVVVAEGIDIAPSGCYDAGNDLTRRFNNPEAREVGDYLGIDRRAALNLTLGETLLFLTEGTSDAWVPYRGRIQITLGGQTFYDAPAIQGGYGPIDFSVASSGRLQTVLTDFVDSGSNVNIVNGTGIVYSAANSQDRFFYGTQIGDPDHFGEMTDVDININEYAGIGVIVRGNGDPSSGSATGYRCEFGAYTSFPAHENFAITRLDGGSTTEVASTDLGTGDGDPHDVRVEAEGNTIRMYLDGAGSPDLTYGSATSYTTQEYVGGYLGRFGGSNPSVVTFETNTLGGAASASMPPKPAVHQRLHLLRR